MHRNLTWIENFERLSERGRLGLRRLGHLVQFPHRPLTPEVVTRLNPGLSLAELATGIDEIGYPGAATHA